MGRLIGWLIGAPLAAAAAVFAVANRTSVVADLWPLPWTMEAPLYLFVLLALLVGFLAGAAVAWASSLAAKRRVRAAARVEIEAARREVAARAAMPPAAETPLHRPLLPPFA
ncbi:MAG: lipopolysaccharide assembly protein LapA domain-containing protein [Pseudomonadota bacterium]